MRGNGVVLFCFVWFGLVFFNFQVDVLWRCPYEQIKAWYISFCSDCPPFFLILRAYRVTQAISSLYRANKFLTYFTFAHWLFPNLTPHRKCCRGQFPAEFVLSQLTRVSRVGVNLVNSSRSRAITRGISWHVPLQVSPLTPAHTGSCSLRLKSRTSALEWVSALTLMTLCCLEDSTSRTNITNGLRIASSPRCDVNPVSQFSHYAGICFANAVKLKLFVKGEAQCCMMSMTGCVTCSWNVRTIVPTLSAPRVHVPSLTKHCRSRQTRELLTWCSLVHSSFPWCHFDIEREDRLLRATSAILKQYSLNQSYKQHAGLCMRLIQSQQISWISDTNCRFAPQKRWFAESNMKTHTNVDCRMVYGITWVWKYFHMTGLHDVFNVLFFSDSPKRIRC